MYMISVVVAGVLLVAASSACAALTISLEGAFARVLEQHPELRALEYRREALSADVESAALAPQRSVVFGAENALGSGAASGFDSAEFSLSLASVLERGGKRDARRAVAGTQLAALGLREQARRLDLLAEVARRYLEVTAAQEQANIARAELAQLEHISRVVQAAVTQGGAPESQALAAQAARLRVVGALRRIEREAGTAKRRLGVLWGDVEARFDTVAFDLYHMPRIADHGELTGLLERAPELRAFADESRVREARLQLARSAGHADLGWSVGARRLQAGSDWALVAEVSMPLDSVSRSRPAVRAAQAELAALDYERDAASRSLEATLLDAHARLEAAVADSRMIGDEVLPLLARAERAAEQAYQRGAAGFLEWSQIQSDSAAARRERLAVCIDAHRALIELQRLSGESLLPHGAASGESLP